MRRQSPPIPYWRSLRAGRVVPTLIFNLSDNADKPIAPLGRRLNKLMPVLAKRLPQDRDVVGEVGFLNDRVGPYQLHQLIFFQQTPVTLDQHKQEIEDFGLKRDDLAVAHQQALGGVQPVGAELINLILLAAHHCVESFTDSALNDPRSLLPKRCRTSL